MTSQFRDTAAIQSAGRSPGRTWASDHWIGTVGRQMLLDVAGRAVLVTLALSIPVILLSLRLHLPAFALPPERLARMVLAISSMILSMTMPALVAIAIAWAYYRFVDDGLVVALQSAGRSARAIIMPALIVAIGTTGTGFALAHVLGPGGARDIHDTLFFVRRDLNFGLLTPGVFHHFDREEVTIFFGRRLGDGAVRDIFINQSDRKTQQQKTYRADNAVLAGTHGNRALLLLNGSVIVEDDDTTELNQIRFQQAIWRPGTAEQTRASVFYDEMETSVFLANFRTAMEEAGSARSWLREAVKRFLVPWLSLSHGLLAISILVAWGKGTGRDRHTAIAALIAGGLVLVLHAAFVVLAESTVWIGSFGAGGFLLLLGTELAAAVFLLRRADDPLSEGQLWSMVSEAGQRFHFSGLR